MSLLACISFLAHVGQYDLIPWPDVPLTSKKKEKIGLKTSNKAKPGNITPHPQQPMPGSCIVPYTTTPAARQWELTGDDS